MRLRMGFLIFSAAAALVAVASPASADIITMWSFDSAPFAIGPTGNTVASNMGSQSGTGYAIGYTNSITNPGTTATYTYDSVNAAGSSVNLTATVDTTLHPYNSDPGVASQKPQNDILSSSGGGLTENTWRVRSLNDLNNGNLGFSRAAPQFTQGTQWVTNSIGYSKVAFSFDWYTTPSSINAMQVQYSTNGTNWTNVPGGALKTSLGDSFQSATSPNFTVSLPADAANAAYLGIRLVTAYDSSTGSPDYSDTTGMTYNNNSGNWRLDNLQFTGIPTLRANPYSTLAFDNATVQPTGPRTAGPPNADYGKIYFDIEGANNGPYADYGVADFMSSTFADPNGNPFPSTPMGLNSITVTLSQANASFTNAGMLNFYLSEDTTASIQPADNAVIFDATDSEGLNGQLAPLHMLGSGMFTGTDTPTDTSGTLDTFTFPPDSSTQLDSATVAYVLGVLANGGNLRVVITPADPHVAATYAGFSNTMYENLTVTGPTLILDLSF